MAYLSLPAALVLLVAIALSLSILSFHRRFLRRITAIARKKVIGDKLSARAKENGFELWRLFAVWSTTKYLSLEYNVPAVQAHLK